MSLVKAKRLLIVEDDPAVAMVVEELLRHMGHEPIVNLTLPNAMLELDAGDIYAALLDLNLRGESARCIALEMLSQNIPFLVISGGDMMEFRKEFPQIPVIAKPFGKALLEQAVNKLLDGHSTG
jgi:DNA-binding response OmpR family regulator